MGLPGGCPQIIETLLKRDAFAGNPRGSGCAQRQRGVGLDPVQHDLALDPRHRRMRQQRLLHQKC